MRCLFLVALLASACSSPDNTAFIPLGSRCERNDQCGTTPYECLQPPEFVGGYCTRSCTTDADCPTDGVCLVAAAKCRRKCIATVECREGEGYVCRDKGATSRVCDRP
jgi:hypothetical protein